MEMFSGDLFPSFLYVQHFLETVECSTRDNWDFGAKLGGLLWKSLRQNWISITWVSFWCRLSVLRWNCPKNSKINDYRVSWGFFTLQRDMNCRRFFIIMWCNNYLPASLMVRPSHFFHPKFVHVLVQCCGDSKTSPEAPVKRLLNFNIRPLQVDVFWAIILTFSTCFAVALMQLGMSTNGERIAWGVRLQRTRFPFAMKLLSIWTNIIAQCVQPLSETGSRFDTLRKNVF